MAPRRKRLNWYTKIKARVVKLIGSTLRWVLPHNKWGDFIYSALRFVIRQRRIPHSIDTATPRFNDRLFRLKVDGTLYAPLRQFVTDKEHAKLYIAAVVGREHTIDTYNIIHTTEEVDSLNLERFPCVLKPTHLSGSALMQITHTDPPDRTLLKKWLNTDYYKLSREQNYRYLRPKIIVEEFFPENGLTPPKDYKFYCFYGVPKFIHVDSGRHIYHTRNFYDTLWNRLYFTFEYPATPVDISKPSQLQKMLDIAANLSRPFSFIRIDMYTDGVQVKVGELTNCPESAGGKLFPPDTEVTLGRLFERYQGN